MLLWRRIARGPGTEGEAAANGLDIVSSPGYDVAPSNLAANGLAGLVEVRLADASRACRLGPFDMGLVNIGASTIERILTDLAGALAPGGRAILTGILIEDEERLLEAATGVGLVLVERHRSRPWSALVLRRS